jgi:hypothetical protein
MTEVAKRASAPVPADWTYAPAPESTEIVTLRERALVSRRERLVVLLRVEPLAADVQPVALAQGDDLRRLRRSRA